MKTPFSTCVLPHLSGIAILLVLGGCAPLSGPRAAKASASTVTANGASANLAAAGSSDGVGYDCPADPNIKPDYDYNFNGSGFFTACQNLDKRDTVLIHGKTANSNMICVFPAQYIDATHLYWKPDLQTGAPMYQCVNVSSDTGAYVTFTGVNYNALFIVESTAARDQMQVCLADGNFYSCPNYSYGIFR